MSPIFKCLICRKDIERSKKTFWSKKGHLLCSSCLDNMDVKLKKNLGVWPRFLYIEILIIVQLNKLNYSCLNFEQYYLNFLKLFIWWIGLFLNSKTLAFEHADNIPYKIELIKTLIG